MTYLDDLLDHRHLQQMIDEGYVRVQTHPEYPFSIACYTKEAMFERKWNHTTMTCRGLIWNHKSGEVLARPFKKFFNLGEPGAVEFADDDWVTVYDKVDGSLGIAYEAPDGPAIATKGSFTSEQAQRGTELLRELYPMYQHDDVHTDLFEIIYPENRIVLDYKNLEGLVYLGSVDIEDGSDYWNGVLMSVWGIPRNHFMMAGFWEEVKDQIKLDRPNAEGVVVHCEERNERLKLKQEDYIELHKVMTGLNERQLWEWLSQGKSWEEVLSSLPEELHGWAEPILMELSEKYSNLVQGIGRSFQYHIGKAEDRKDFALRIKEYPSLDKGVMFCMLDGQFERGEQLIWKALRP